ncbi:hypothetical protein BO71DRAFT_281666, partial [Aspergillus ellipticus CBS 707.79]
IGSLGLDKTTGTIQVANPPLTLTANELIRTCGLPHYTTSPGTVYTSAVDYIHSLLTLQTVHLKMQRNSIYDSPDCREKYTSRHLMKSLAMHFLPAKDNHGQFKLFCDDFCLGNVLVDETTLQVVAVIDWEFSYAAPASFAGSIPSWLLLRQPHTLVNDLGRDGFLDLFLPKAEILLEELEKRESLNGVYDSGKRLSVRMRQSIRDRSAWFFLACRVGYAVDLLYWELLDEFCWGTRESVAQRVYDFTTGVEMHQGREGFVRLKMGQLEGYFEDLGEDGGVGYEEE